jgi:hypothetical protein
MTPARSREGWVVGWEGREQWEVGGAMGSVIGSSMTFCLVVLLSASDFPNLHHFDEKLNKPLFILEVSSISPFLLMEREAGSLHGSDLF